MRTYLEWVSQPIINGVVKDEYHRAKRRWYKVLADFAARGVEDEDRSLQKV